MKGGSQVNFLKKFNQLGINLEEACSTIVMTKAATINGLTIVGRNTDYSGIDAWPKYQTVSFVSQKMDLNTYKQALRVF